MSTKANTGSSGRAEDRNTTDPHAAKIRRRLRTSPIAVALALAACGSSSVAATTTPDRPSSTRVASAPAHQTVPHRTTRHTGRVIKVRPSQYGRILTNGGGRTIYLFTHDQSTVSTCYGPCAAAWPPVLTNGSPTATGSLASAPLGTTRRHDGTVQVTYAGHPLYYYIGDARAGEILCQNVDEFGGTWLIVSPHGTPIR
ncbi:MAG: hypothetical protein JO363_09300 [Solirubrobacterales bacterium]|nr:hypothetical protein [Solirubrobacterales bacterium]